MQRRERHLASTKGTVVLAEGVAQHPVSHLTTEFRLRLTSGLRGGILADPIGFGKTAVALSLVATSLPPPRVRVPTPTTAECPHKLLLSRATLVIVPSHLLAQWMGEAKKFFGYKLDAIAIHSVNDVKKLDPKRGGAGLVVVSQALFGSPKCAPTQIIT
jgi:SNF2 family DNA or RNA helicase